MTLEPSSIQILLHRCLFTSMLSIYIVSLFACNNIPSYGQQAGANLQIAVESPERIRFSGKGAGAGIMLMSTLGAAGIAVGVAIDEGIGKDIDSAAVEVGFDIDAIVREAYQNAVNVQAGMLRPLWGIKVVRYGFIARRSNGDPSVAQLHLHFFDSQNAYDTNKATLRIHYPEHFEVDTTAASLPLATLKSEGHKITEMHSNAMADVMTRWFSSK